MRQGIKVENLSIGYRKPVLSGLSFFMDEGEFWAVVGPNGAGKSTLIKTILGILTPLSGNIYIHGVNCSQSCEQRRYLSYVPQMESYSHIFPATVIDVVLSGIFPQKRRFEKISSKEVDRALNCIKMLGLSGLEKKRFLSLSGGQQRRVLIARALIGEPHYIFLDEPTTGVDLKNSRKILDLISFLNKSRGIGICMVTHDINFIWQHIDKVVLVGGGKFFIGSRDEILNEKLLSQIYEVSVKIVKTDFGPIFLIGDRHV